MCFRNIFEVGLSFINILPSAEITTDGKAVVTGLALIFKYTDVG